MKRGRVITTSIKPKASAVAVAGVFGKRKSTLETRVLVKNGKPLARTNVRVFGKEKT